MNANTLLMIIAAVSVLVAAFVVLGGILKSSSKK